MLVSDAAMATRLLPGGELHTASVDELNLTNPAAVARVHHEYAAAGAEILQTNTFGASRPRLTVHGLGDRVAPINTAAVRLAREAATDGQYVAGVLGPTGLAAGSDVAIATREQADALLAAGVDLLVFETFANLRELRAAVISARDASSGVPIVALVTVDDAGAFVGDLPIEACAREMDGWAVDAVGVNCSFGPRSTLDALRRFGTATAKPLCARPSAGVPRRVSGRDVYPCSPEQMAEYTLSFIAAGARIVGGCCGSTAEYVRLVRGRV